MLLCQRALEPAVPPLLTGTSRPCAGLVWLSLMAPHPRARRRSEHSTVLTLRLSRHSRNNQTPHGALLLSRPGFSLGDLGGNLRVFCLFFSYRPMASDEYLASYLKSLSRVRKMGAKVKEKHGHVRSQTGPARRRHRSLRVSPRRQLSSSLGMSSCVQLCEPCAPQVICPAPRPREPLATPRSPGLPICPQCSRGSVSSV